MCLNTLKNKRTGIEYSCPATCPVVVSKLNGEYYLTATLAYISEIIGIQNPDSMEVFNMLKLRRKKNKVDRNKMRFRSYRL